MAERRQYLTLTPRPHAFKSIAEYAQQTGRYGPLKH
jgi:hypothetical protein